MAKISAGAAVAAAAVNNSFMQPMRWSAAGYGGGTFERLRHPGAVPCRIECTCAHLVARKLILCALCADAMCIFCVCASCTAATNIDMLCQQTCHWPGRCVAAAWPAACLRRSKSSSTRKGAIASALTHATAQPEPALSASTHSRRTAYRAPCIDSGGLSRAFAVLWSVGDASSGGGGSSPLALSMCTLVCVCYVCLQMQLEPAVP